jgi:hypothetical protein
VTGDLAPGALEVDLWPHDAIVLSGWLAGWLAEADLTDDPGCWVQPTEV